MSTQNASNILSHDPATKQKLRQYARVKHVVRNSIRPSTRCLDRCQHSSSLIRCGAPQKVKEQALRWRLLINAMLYSFKLSEHWEWRGLAGFTRQPPLQFLHDMAALWRLCVGCWSGLCHCATLSAAD